MNLNLSHFFLVPLFKLVIVYFFLSVENVYTSTFSCILVIKLVKKNCCTLFFELTNSRNKLIINEKKFCLITLAVLHFYMCLVLLMLVWSFSFCHYIGEGHLHLSAIIKIHWLKSYFFINKLKI